MAFRQRAVDRAVELRGQLQLSIDRYVGHIATILSARACNFTISRRRSLSPAAWVFIAVIPLIASTTLEWLFELRVELISLAPISGREVGGLEWTILNMAHRGVSG